MNIIFFVMFFPLFIILSFGMVKMFKEVLKEKDDLFGQILLLCLFWAGWVMAGTACAFGICK